MNLYKCKKCGYVYNPHKGDPDRNIQPPKAFEDLDEDWTCPICNAPKSEFIKGPEV